MKNSLSLLTLLFISSVVFAQNNVGIGTNNPRNSAILDLYSQNQGLLLPRVDTLSIMSLGALDHGLMVYDTTINKILIWNGTSWESAAGSSDLNGLSDVNITSPATNNFLRYIGSQWINTSSIFPINESVPAAGTQFQLNHSGLGTTFRVTNTSPFANDYVMSVEALGDAIAGYFVNNQSTATNQALYTHTLGAGPALVGLGLSNTATAARFANTTAGNTQPTLILENAGTGLGLNVVSGGVQVNRFGGGGQKMIITDNNGLLDTAAITSSPWVNNTGSIFYNSGDVGIGIASPTPQARLNVVSTAFLNTQLESNNDNGTWLSMNNSSAGGQWFHIVSTGATNSEGAGKLIFNRGTAQGTSGGNILTMDHASNNIGIGTSSPNARLQINSALSATALRLTNDATGTATTDGLLFSTNSAGIANIRNRENANMFIGTNNLIGQLVLAPTGNVGIGTSSPANKLEVIGDAAKFDSVIIANNAQAGYILTAADATGAASWQPGAGVPTLQSAYNGGQTIQLNGTNDITISNTGTTPVLNLDNNGTLRLGNAAASIGTVKFQISHDVANSEPLAHIQNTNNAGDASLRFWQGAAAVPYALGIDANDQFFKISNGNQVGINDRFVIDNIGRIGIGTSAPELNLDLLGPNLSPVSFGVKAGGGATYDHIYLEHDLGTAFLRAGGAENGLSIQVGSGSTGTYGDGSQNYIEGIRILSNGNVGIGTSTPANKLEVIGDAAKFDSVIIANNAQAGYVLTAADATGAASWQAPASSPWSLNATDVFYTAGNVGIGTNAPNAPLQFSNALAPRKIVLFEATNNDHQYFGFGITGSELRYQINSPASHVFYASSSATTSTELMRISSNGNVGIGTAAPSNILSLGSATNQKIWIENSVGATTPGRDLTVAAGASSLGFNNINGGNLILQAGTGTGSGSSSILFQNGTTLGNTPTAQTMTTKMAILGNGNVGIGTSTPLGKLHVENSDYGAGSMILTSTASGAGATIRFTNPAAGNRTYDLIGSTGSGAGTGAGSFGIFDNTNSAYRFVIGPTGNVGIGTSTPSSLGRLHVAGSSLVVDSENGLNGIIWRTNIDDIHAKMYRDNSTARLFVSNANAATTFGVFLGFNGTSWQSSSDKRLKENITQTSHGLADVLKLSVKEYNFKSNENKDIEIGFLAQEVYEILPELVEKGDEGEYPEDVDPELWRNSGFKSWGVDYSRFSVLAIKAIQEQQEIIEAQELRIENLEKQIANTNIENTSLKESSKDSKNTSDTKVLRAQLNAMQAQIDRLNTLLSAEASK